MDAGSVKALQRTRLFASLDKGGDHCFLIPLFGCSLVGTLLSIGLISREVSEL